MYEGSRKHDVSWGPRNNPAVHCAGRKYAFMLGVGCDAEGIVAGNVAKAVFDHLIVAHIKANRNVIVVHGIGALASHHDYRSPHSIPHRVVKVECTTREPVRAAIRFPAAESFVEVVVHAL